MNVNTHHDEHRIKNNLIYNCNINHPIFANAAETLAMGTLNGEQLT